MSNAIIVAALTERIQMCVAAGYCTCTLEQINPSCPCHNPDGIALTAAEKITAPEVIDMVRSEDQEVANPT